MRHQSHPRKTNRIRIRQFFAWWPIEIDGDWRWLETVRVEYEGHTVFICSQFSMYHREWWVPVRFLDLVEVNCDRMVGDDPGQ